MNIDLLKDIRISLTTWMMVVIFFFCTLSKGEKYKKSEKIIGQSNTNLKRQPSEGQLEFFDVDFDLEISWIEQ